VSTGLTPADLGLPKKFESFYPGQDESILSLLECSKRFTLFSSPTGTGKSLIIYALSRVLGGRTLILTGKKGLQSQMIADFGSSGMKEIKGQRNYRCIALGSGGELQSYRPIGKVASAFISCEDGPCRAGIRCSLKASGCPKYDAIRAANESQIVVANYAYWLSMSEINASILGSFDTLILDEAHTAVDWLNDFNVVRLSNKRLSEISEGLPMLTDSHLSLWVQWAGEMIPKTTDLIYAEKEAVLHGCGDISYLFKLQRLERDLKKLMMTDIDWVIEEGGDGSEMISFHPLWTAPLAEKSLFCGIKKVVLTSATLSRDVAKYLGVDDYDYLEAPSKFSYKRRPIIYTKFKGQDDGDDRKLSISYRSSEEDNALLVSRMDEVVQQRLDRKGIILSVSYARAARIAKLSRWSDSGVLFTHKPGASPTMAAIEMFRKMEPPAVLVSPVVGEGYDFIGGLCRYILLPKIPMVPMQSPVMKARQKIDKSYSAYLTALAVVQNVGRGMRSPEDWCEVIIFDGNWEWFFRKAKFAKWFRRACKVCGGLPPALEMR
jgi:Rad3-related DNA helicase